MRASVAVPHVELLERCVGTSRPVGHEFVSSVVEVGDPDLARVESRRGEVAEHVEEGDAVAVLGLGPLGPRDVVEDRKSTRLNSSHITISYAVFCLKKK